MGKFVPDGLQLRPYQKEGVKQLFKIIKERRRALLADEPGLGKTIQAIVLHNVLRSDKILVVTPACVRDDWRKAWEAWTTVGHSVYVVDSSKALRGYGGENVIITGYHFAEAVQDLLPNKFHLVVDEFHYCKNWGAARTQTVVNELIPMSKTFIGITGTPIKKDVPGLHALVSACAPNLFPGDTAFCKTYCHAVWDGYTTQYYGLKNARDLKKRLRKFMVRRYKKYVLTELPDKIYTLVDMAVPEKLRKKSLDYAKLFEMRRGEEIDLDRPAYATSRKDIGLAKVAQVVDRFSTMFEGGSGPIIVFAHHRSVVAELEKGFKKRGLRVECAVGGVSTGARESFKERFQNGEIDIGILSITAMGVGITLTRSSVVAFAELGNTASDMSQAIDRAHRIGQTKNVQVFFCIAKGSLESKIWSSIKQNKKLVEAAL